MKWRDIFVISALPIAGTRTVRHFYCVCCLLIFCCKVWHMVIDLWFSILQACCLFVYNVYVVKLHARKMMSLLLLVLWIFSWFWQIRSGHVRHLSLNDNKQWSWLTDCMVYAVLFRREDNVAFCLHPCLQSAETETEHLRLITDTFIKELLPPGFATNPFVRHLLREIFTCKGVYVCLYITETYIFYFSFILWSASVTFLVNHCVTNVYNESFIAVH